MFPGCDRDLDYKCYKESTGYMACVPRMVTCDTITNCLDGLDEGHNAFCPYGKET